MLEQYPDLGIVIEYTSKQADTDDQGIFAMTQSASSPPIRQHCAEAAVADHHAHATLGNLELHSRVAEQGAVIVGVHVDKARCVHAPTGIDLAPHGAGGVADCHHPLAADEHVALVRIGVGSVDDRGVVDGEIGALAPNVRKCTGWS